MAKILTIHQMVERILRDYPGTRDDDRELIKTLYGKYYGVDYYKPWGAVIKDKNLPSFESIRRCRQKLQEQNEDLRGSKKSEEARLAKQEEYLEYARKGA
jgi:hypothetical protein